MNDLSNKDDRLLTRLRIGGWGVAVALILLPLIMMHVAPQTGFVWTSSDFIFAGVLIGGTGILLEIAVRMSSDWSYRVGAAVALGTSFLLIWSNLAVGYIGSEDNPYNTAFFVVIAVAFAGALLSGLEAKGMALTMAAAGTAHAVAGTIGFPQDMRTAPITIVFVGLWLFSAGLFRRAARRGLQQA